MGTRLTQVGTALARVTPPAVKSGRGALSRLSATHYSPWLICVIWARVGSVAREEATMALFNEETVRRRLLDDRAQLEDDIHERTEGDEVVLPVDPLNDS